MAPDEGVEALFADGYVFNGVTYDRPFRHYLIEKQELPPPPPAPTEQWVVDILQPVLEACYPEGNRAMDYPVFMCEEELAEDGVPPPS